MVFDSTNDDEVFSTVSGVFTVKRTSI